MWAILAHPASLCGPTRRRCKRHLQKENARRGRSRVFEGTTGGEEGRRGSRRGSRSAMPRPPAMLSLVAGRCLLAGPGIHHGTGDEAGVLADRLLDLGRDLRVLLQELLGILP